MPTYEYACSSCGTHIDVFQRFSEAPLTECGVCGGRLRKVFHPAGILFKGSGFYVTDSRKGPAKTAAKGDGEKTDASSTDGAKPTEGAKSGGSKKTESKQASGGESGGTTKEKSA
ncbi:MAG: FmdB family zinc ribbon protein [Actinomycetota bacterium]